MALIDLVCGACCTIRIGDCLRHKTHHVDTVPARGLEPLDALTDGRGRWLRLLLNDVRPNGAHYGGVIAKRRQFPSLSLIRNPSSWTENSSHFSRADGAVGDVPIEAPPLIAVLLKGGVGGAIKSVIADRQKRLPNLHERGESALNYFLARV